MSAVVNSPTADATAAHELAAGDPARTICFGGDGAVTLARFRREVHGVAAGLPDAPAVINLCEDRYRFLVAFCAAAMRGQTTLLPPSRAPAVIDEVLARHPGSYGLGDFAPTAASSRLYALPERLPEHDDAPLAVADDALIAVGFTSGSTGQPRPNPKTWAAFRASTVQNLAALADLFDDPAHPAGTTPLIATVPPQHMYGLEMSVLLPLLGRLAVHRGRPFFPDDVARACADAAAPPLLVTTPVHLHALVESGIRLPALAGIVSATAPLTAGLARAAEVRFGCEVREVFGSTETCVFARRRTATEDAWTPLPGVRLQPQPDGTAVQAPHLPEPVVLADLVEVRGDGRFVLHGRNGDLLEIAGKRASLGDLTRKLLAVPGVEDGVVLQLDEADAAGVRRIAALAVAPGLDAATILRALRETVDPVFLPRPLACVPALPRNETGKLPRAALLALLRS
ncbi:AMP-binding protein [Marilutibacter chinensis]|uniref:AMP-binding protein n=1 Tax=Marilutibacter chinensis TaxID=2912247 RepID=A0ABS9HYA7_9GAMM|nr:AMP-binding protein [Lysobacter chinensis]MCF7223541.1 AMP-binding protein [Lysobacter chinensis]